MLVLLLMDVRTCLLIRGPLNLPMPAFCIKRWPVADNFNVLTVGVVRIPAYGTDGQLIASTVYRFDER